MNEWAKLLEAIAALLWPLFAFAVVFIFRSELKSLLTRVKSGKILGQEIEIDQSLRELSSQAKSAAQETPRVLLGPDSSDTRQELSELDDAVRKVLDEVPKSPKGALLILGAEIEKELRQLLWSSGWKHDVGRVTISRSVEHLIQLGVLPKNLGGSVSAFLDIRSRIIHGYGVPDDEMVRAVDIGLTILKSVLAIPKEQNRVYEIGVDVYEDAEGTRLRPNVKAIVLETTSPGGSGVSFRVFPTTRTNLKKGDRVSWEWNMGLVVGQSWYRNPTTGLIELAWTQSAEFVGRNLDDL